MSASGAGNNVSCILLTLNEEGAIAKVVSDIRRILPEAEIVVVDSSTDNTAEIAQALGCNVIRQTPPRGYGWAMDAGFKNARGQYVVTMDCDDTYPAEALLELVERMDAGADLVSCSRLEKRPPAMKLSHYLANRIFAAAANLICGAKTTDVHTGMRAYRKTMLDSLPFDPEGMALPVELQIGPQRMGFNCQEFFIEYKSRIGDSKIVPLEGTIWTFRRIWRWRRFFNQHPAHFILAIMFLLFPIAFYRSIEPALSQTKTPLPQSKQAASEKKTSTTAAKSPAPVRMVTCRRFLQNSRIIGEQEIKITPQACRVDLKRGGWIQLTLGPDFKKTVLINESSRTFCRNPKDTWWSRAIGFSTDAKNKSARKINSKKVRVLDLDTKWVSVQGVPPEPPTECYYYNDPAIPAAFCTKMAIQSAAPDMGGLLMRVKTSNQEGPGALRLDTLKADKITVQSSQFEIPKGFKEVFSPQEIMLGTGADGLKDFLP